VTPHLRRGIAVSILTLLPVLLAGFALISDVFGSGLHDRLRSVTTAGAMYAAMAGIALLPLLLAAWVAVLLAVLFVATRRSLKPDVGNPVDTTQLATSARRTVSASDPTRR
jgi:hypothetical protein